jgi:hypothetical protein
MPPRKKSKPESSTPTASTNPIQPPDWPPFVPLIPSSNLTLDPKVPGQIVTIQNFWTATLCKNYVSFLSSLPFSTTPGKPKKGEAVRVNDRFQIDDAAFAERLWSSTALKDLILGHTENDGLGLEDSQRKELWGGEVVCMSTSSPRTCLNIIDYVIQIGLNPNIRIYRYSKGQFFDQHCMQVCQRSLAVLTAGR